MEIIGHEIEGLEMTISRGLDDLPDSVKAAPKFSVVREAHHSLVDRLRFLSPLKLSGEKVRTWISGKDVVEYIKGFMGDSLERRGITLDVSQAFNQFSVCLLYTSRCV